MTTLDHKAEERLKEWEKEWDEQIDFVCSGNLTLAGLRLLLEHFEPLRELIRQIAAPDLPAGAADAVPEPPAQDAASAAALQAAHEESAQLRASCAALTQELEHVLQHLKAADQAVQQAHAQCNALRSERDALQHALQDAHHQLALERQRTGSGTETLVHWLERHPDAARRLGLNDLDGEMQDTIRLVAVLSQWDNILRLHGLLTEAGHATRQTDDEGITVLETALSWHNVNWRERPFRLERPTPGTPFDFNRQQRSSQTPTGETITQVLVPAIVDSNGKVICKAVVETR